MEESEQASAAIRLQVLEYMPRMVDGSVDEALDGSPESLVRISASSGCWEPSYTSGHLYLRPSHVFSALYHSNIAGISKFSTKSVSKLEISC
jgi:hypothetical protein